MLEKKRLPKPGEIYDHFKDKPYQIIAVATHSETRESMVVYQALYGDFKTYVRPLDMFLSEVDHIKYPDVKQKYRFELREGFGDELEEKTNAPMITELEVIVHRNDSDVEGVNSVLLNFLDAESYSKKLEVITSNRKHMTDRLINDMAVSLDCTVEDGPIDNRIQELIFCLKAMCRFEDRRMR